MAGIKNIRDLYKKVGEKVLREVLEGEIRVTEKFDAYRFAIEKNPHNYKIYFYGKNGKAPLTKIDRTLSDLYEGAVEYIESLPYEVQKSLPLRHRFGFSWFPSKNPILTEYERRPKNGLILTDITIRDKNNDVTRELHESEIYQRWANIFSVEYAAPIHNGCLDESVVNFLMQIAKDEEESQMLAESFETKGYLNNLHPNIEALIFETKDVLFKISQNEESTVSEKRSHMFDLLLMDILEHVETFNVSGVRCAAQRTDEAYLEAVSEIFNDYVDKRGNFYLDTQMEKPKFLQKSGKFNKKWIKNPKTRSILEKDKRYNYLLSVFLANFRKTKYPSGLLNESIVNRYNRKIEDLNKVIGDDFGFLEFSTIIREDKEEKIKRDPDYARAVGLMTRFFDPSRNFEEGEKQVNVIITNAGMLTNRIKEIADSMMSSNGKKVVVIHCGTYLRREFGANADSIEKILAKFINTDTETFADYRMIDLPIASQVLNVLRPHYEPVSINMSGNHISMQKEIEGTSVVYSNQSGLMKRLQVAPIKDLRRKSLLGTLENDAYKKFCELTPECVHPYWPEIKNSFDKYTYK
jgi:hypothetical protein